jgi:molecular chaperone DnaK (HSP70)
MKHKVIGIDLGTTYCCVAAYDDVTRTAEVTLDENKSRTTPSVVGLDPANPNLVIVGEVAKRNGPADPANTIIEIKREMGELFKASSLDKFNARSKWHEGQPVRVKFGGEWRLPQEISAFILMRMKAIAEREFGEEVRDAVITVPAYFTANQKKATEDAALLAGLYPRQLIPEPTAAAACYGLDRYEERQHIYLVYDLGGGTFDVSIIQVQEEKVEVIATSGDPRLGGGDFDDLIASWALAECRKQGLDLTANPVARARMKFLAEQTKIQLSRESTADLVVSDPQSGQSRVLRLARQQFEQMIDPLLQRSLTSVVQAMGFAAEKGVNRETIDAILLVGGSTKIPHVKSVLLDHFRKGDEFVRDDGNPDLLVARGAALIAQKFQPSPAPFDIRHKPESTLINLSAQSALDITLITEHSLGVGVQENKFDPLIKRGSCIPYSASKPYTNPEGATVVNAPIYQGEGDYVQQNTLIGNMQIGPMTPLPAGQHHFDVTFSLDENGLLSVLVNHVNESKTYKAEFRHEASVKGDDALISLRENILASFSPSPPLGDSTVGDPPQEYQPTPPPRAGQEGAAAPPAEGAAPSEAPPARGSSVGAGMAALVLLTVEVKDEFKSLVRRAHKQLLRGTNPALVAAYNAFVTAANSGTADEQLTDLFDELDEAYSAAKRLS